MFDKLDVYVYSGTGNTLQAAKCIGETAKVKGSGCDIKMIDACSRPEEHKPATNHLLGLMAPTIGAIQPISFFSFILRLPKGSRQKVFLASTGAWTKIGPLFIPGYIGFGLYLAALILIIKGYDVVGITGFGMSQNWTTLIPPNSEKLEVRINGEIHATTEKFALELLSGKRVYRRIIDLVVTLLIFPLPLVFILAGHLFLAKSMFAGSGCDGCGFCAANCPRKAIKMLGGRHKRPYWTYKCEQCMRCAGYCPKKAIDSNTFFIVSICLIFFVFHADVWILNRLEPVLLLFGPAKAVGLWLLQYILFVLLMAVIYALIYLLNRILVFNKIFTVLSFTHYWRKYRQMDVKISELTAHSPEQASMTNKRRQAV